MSKLQPEFYMMNELLINRAFFVPTYQRPYSWLKKQRNDLLKDIENLIGQAEPFHFMATIVCVVNKEAGELKSGFTTITQYDIVDGQQRLTSLVLLLSALSNYLKTKSDKMYKDIHNLLVVGDDQSVLLNLTHDTRGILSDYIKHGKKPNEGKIKNSSDNNLLNAIIEFENWAKNLGNVSKIHKVIELILNNLGFVFYVIDNPDTVYRVFEVLNSRGRPVNTIDKIKTIMMGIVVDSLDEESSRIKVQELNNIWGEIYKTLGIDDIPGEEMVRYLATFINSKEPSRILSEEDSIEAIKNYCINGMKKKKYDTPKILSNKLLEISEKYKLLVNNPLLYAVTDIIQARFLAVTIMISDMGKKEKDDLLDIWEKISFIIYGMFGKDSRSEVGYYTKLAYNIYNKKGNGKTSKKMISSLLDLYSKYPVDQAVDLFMVEDVYLRRKEDVRYFLHKYEIYLAGGTSKIDTKQWRLIWDNSPDKTIEHIFPQNYTKDPYWVGKSKQGVKPETFIHRIGNLTLLSPQDNSAANAYGYYTKKGIYKKSSLHINKIIAEKFDDWNIATVEERKEELKEFAIKEWKIK